MKNRLSHRTMIVVIAASLALWLAAPQNLPAQAPQDDEHTTHHAAKEAQKDTETKPQGKRMPEMSKGMRMRCRVMMQMRIRPNDPAAVLALKEQLDLSDGQVKKLETIMDQARDKTESILTSEQQKKLEPLAGMPETSMEMHRQMMERMQKMKKTKDKDQMQCPMMEMMMQQDADGHKMPGGKQEK